MDRVFYTQHLRNYLDSKMLLLTGPRQSGKTTLAKQLPGSCDYLNYDHDEHRRWIKEKSWDRKKDFVIFDEIHKMPSWKRWLKGVYDVEGIPPGIVVTGSAQMDTYKKVGDSMAGRYFQYRIHPFDVRELFETNHPKDPQSIVEQLLLYGGFPEPFLKADKKFYGMWKKTHMDIILKQDLIAIENVRDLQKLQILIDLLCERVGSPVSYQSMSEDLETSDKTIKRWLTILENMYVTFKILPLHKNIARANKKKPKYYFFDLARVQEKGARLENLVACSLFKQCQYRNDCFGEDWNLHYVSKQGGFEIDFALSQNQKLKYLIEVKYADDTPTKNFQLFGKDLPNTPKIQLVHSLPQEKTYPNHIEVRRLGDWLCTW
ncbi:MAG: ATP-binding protein [Bdellovibrionota bacterium]